MIKLNRHELDFELGFAYLHDNLENTNMLSSALIKLVEFKDGKFFTILPNHVDLKKINEFQLGGIAIGVRNQVSSILLNKLLINDKLSCIFDDVTDFFESGYEDPLFLSCGLVYDKEIYYLVKKNSASLQLIDQCFHVSNAIWHSLCVLSEINFIDMASKKLSLKEIEDIARNTQLIIVGSYDGEGYIFWEKSRQEEK